MVGKIHPFFPMIGKFFRPFSNDWKKFSAQARGALSTLGARAARPRGRQADGFMYGNMDIKPKSCFQT
ncbi:MAG: hypothetical protein IKQ15_10775 [Kiritimatiellae bacterium]|nr:hypothetical protein [Kiritimatiellia bacterium]